MPVSPLLAKKSRSNSNPSLSTETQAEVKYSFVDRYI